MSVLEAEQVRRDNANNTDSALDRRRAAADDFLSKVVIPAIQLMAKSNIDTAIIDMRDNTDIVGMVSGDLKEGGYDVSYRRFRRELVISW